VIGNAAPHYPATDDDNLRLIRKIAPHTASEVF